MRYEWREADKSIVMYDDEGNIVLVQDINPKTGKPFEGKEEAEEWAEEYIELSAVGEEIEPDIYLTNDAGEKKSVFQKDEDIYIKVDLKNEELNMKLVVPVRNKLDGRTEKVFLVDMVNGIVEKSFRMEKSGIYEIRWNEIYDPQTMDPVVPDSDKVIMFTVVE